jgi:agmatinase
MNAETMLRGPQTFMGLPHEAGTGGAGAAILGCPFDCGTHAFRVGAREGPTAIRAQSGLIRRYESERADADVLAEMGAVDAGDVAVTPGRAEEAFPLIEEAAAQVGSDGAVVVGLGGDGSVSLPLVRAAARRHPGLAVLHVDSHTDAYPVDPVHRYDAATQFTHAALEQRVRPSASWHVGLRGTTTRQGAHTHTRDLGYQTLTMTEMTRLGVEETGAMLRERLAGQPVYLSWDMDVFDPSCAPGVCTPAWGGLSAREGLAFLRALEGLDIVATDVNTVSPGHDHGGMTAFLAGAVVFEILLLAWRARSGIVA